MITKTKAKEKYGPEKSLHGAWSAQRQATLLKSQLAQNISQDSCDQSATLYEISYFRAATVQHGKDAVRKEHETKMDAGQPQN